MIHLSHCFHRSLCSDTLYHEEKTTKTRESLPNKRKQIPAFFHSSYCAVCSKFRNLQQRKSRSSDDTRCAQIIASLRVVNLSVIVSFVCARVFRLLVRTELDVCPRFLCDTVSYGAVL